MSARDDGAQVVVVHEPDDASDSSADDGTSDEEGDESRWQENKGAELLAEYWHVQKLVKYMKVSILCGPNTV